MYPKTQREPATAARARKYGLANQIGYEQSSKIEREELRAKVASGKGKAKRKRAGALDSGTVGGAWMSGLYR